MTTQQRISGVPERDRNGEASTHASGASQPALAGVDDLLDEIDSLLEENAEAFVKSFVQKGGQ